MKKAFKTVLALALAAHALLVGSVLTAKPAKAGVVIVAPRPVIVARPVTVAPRPAPTVAPRVTPAPKASATVGADSKPAVSPKAAVVLPVVTVPVIMNPGARTSQKKCDDKVKTDCKP